MIIGMSADIVSVKRVEGIYQRHENFLAKIFTQREQEYFSKKGNKIESVSAGCCKRVGCKALGTGFRQFPCWMWKFYTIIWMHLLSDLWRSKRTCHKEKCEQY